MTRSLLADALRDPFKDNTDNVASAANNKAIRAEGRTSQAKQSKAKPGTTEWIICPDNIKNWFSWSLDDYELELERALIFGGPRAFTASWAHALVGRDRIGSGNLTV